MKQKTLTAAIIGASGYSGLELLRLLSRRSDVTFAGLAANASAGKAVRDVCPALGGAVDMNFEPVDAVLCRPADVVFVALPSGQAMEIVPALREQGRRVIDLGGDFRLPSAELYTRYYKHEHTAPSLLHEAVYGLPEVYGARIAGAGLVANPGCYPTSILLPLIPLVGAGVIETMGIVINSLSGVSGAGRSASAEMSFAEVNENVRAYKIGTHQHIPEIESVLQATGGKEVQLSFVPHLAPLTRGIYTTVHASLAPDIREEHIHEIYRERYGNAPFVRIRRDVPQLQDVVRTNYCDIHVVVNRRANQVILVSAIDNLVKGAAGQAIQNMNLMFGLPETTGLRSSL